MPSAHLPRTLRLLSLCAALAGCASGVRKEAAVAPLADAPKAAAVEAARVDPQAGAALTDAEMVEHVLSRVTFGRRPQDAERVARIGVAAFLDEQLQPASLKDDAVERQLAGFRVLTAQPKELMRELVARQEQKKEQRQQKIAAAGSMLEAMLPDEPAGSGGDAMKGGQKPAAEATSPAMEGAPPAIKEEQGKGSGKAKGRAEDGPGGPYVGEMAQAKIVRAIGSERQLQELMADFWFNHFNVFGGKDRIRALLPSYERDAIRAHALGSFRDLLYATARHPAMLVYLDNWRSSSPFAPTRRVERRWPYRKRADRVAAEERELKQRRGRGLNENYARELLELHTLGVEGGYTQADVTEVARCFTGWTVAEMRDDPHYVFRRNWHDEGDKHVLGKIIDKGGEGDGEAVLDLLARHPSTARFIASKLVRRFVSDEPPQLLVERVAETYEKTDGDIRSMLRTIFASPDFWSRRALHAKVRSPLELVAGSVRALGAPIDDALNLSKAVERIGQPLYGAQPPTGFGDTADAWISPGALLARINFGLSLAEGKLDGVDVDLVSVTAAGVDPESVLSRAQGLLGARELSDKTRLYILGKLRELPAARVARQPQLIAARAVGLLLGAPELQRR